MTISKLFRLPPRPRGDMRFRPGVIMNKYQLSLLYQANVQPVPPSRRVLYALLATSPLFVSTASHPNASFSCVGPLSQLMML